jgi:beta-fructofuranosidase
VFTHSGRTYIVCGGNLNDSKGGEAVVNVYRAENPELTTWKYLGVLFKHPDRDVRNIECPLFFPLGNSWVLIVSQGRPVQYFVGALDASSMRFKPKSRGVMDHGNFYAPNCLLDERGRRVLWGWVPDFPSGKGWNGCMTLPRVLTLADDLALIQTPAPELMQLRGERRAIPDFSVEGELVLDKPAANAVEIKLTLDLAAARESGVELRRSIDQSAAVSVSFDGQRLKVGDVIAPIQRGSSPKTLDLRIFLDHSVLEVYAGGRVCVTRVIRPGPGPGQLGVAIWAKGGEARVESMERWPMSSIWPAGSRR